MLRRMDVAIRCTTILGIAISAFVWAAAPAAAGGSSWNVTADHYEAGETAFAWAPIAWEHNPALGTPEDGPYFAYLAPYDPIRPVPETPPPPDAVEIAELHISLEPYDAGGIRFGPHHTSIEFVVPDLPDGLYSILHCDSPCSTTLADLTFGLVSIGPEAIPLPTAPPPTTPPPSTTPPTTATAPTTRPEVAPVAGSAPSVDASSTRGGTNWNPYVLGAATGALLALTIITITSVRARASSTVRRRGHQGSG